MIGMIMGAQFAAQLIGGAARARNAYQMAGKQIPMLNTTMRNLESSKGYTLLSKTLVPVVVKPVKVVPILSRICCLT